MKKIVLFIFVVCCSFSYDLSIYPKPKDGFVQKVINLEPRNDEDSLRVEIYFGKDILTDCNYHFFVDGRLKELNLDGWGYKYYEFDGKDELANTLMMCDGAKKSKFVTYQDVLKPRYNSKLPIVVYVKKDIKLQVKVFKEIESEIR
ncbi:hypothetical protein BFG05_02450 [Campylobacter pinnipediorum subsp. pinnipediorum]|uniref:ecotin family protein n=1 Tax=Campylobacter pinnipediorum TaxID=1965231 RepID=UPI0009957B92|nr:ecotin family protein [Campylobacter pinnipediorum]OPA78090.1 hypothetical protein BFG05_02450 [Campylobacter pinnipediorum subsp. pinnipediorum]